MNIVDLGPCHTCGAEWCEDSTATGAIPVTCPTCDPRAARHRAIREQTRKKLAETRSDSILADASQVSCPGKDKIAEALRGLARAAGRPDTSVAARELAVQALAWSLALSVASNGVADTIPQ